MKKIKVINPDNSSKEFPIGVTPLDIAKDISNSLAKKVICSKINDELYDIKKYQEAIAYYNLANKNPPEGNNRFINFRILKIQHILWRIPELMKGLGSGVKEFKKGLKDDDSESEKRENK